MNTTQKLEVKNLASAGYMTGGKVTAADGSVAMLQAVLFSLDYQVMLVYWNPDTDEEFMLPLAEAVAEAVTRRKPCL